LFIGRVGARTRLEQWEPGELRGSRRVLREAGGAIPPAYSPIFHRPMAVQGKKHSEVTTQ